MYVALFSFLCHVRRLQNLSGSAENETLLFCSKYHENYEGTQQLHNCSGRLLKGLVTYTAQLKTAFLHHDTN